MAHRLMARILTTEKDSEMNQTTNINISCDHKNEVSTETKQAVSQNAPPDPELIYPNVQSRDIELTEGINNQEQEIEFLETLITEYQSKPFILNGFLICKGKNLMNLVKLACQADKVELVLNEDISCTSCTDQKYTYVSSVLVTKDGKTQEFKYGFNEIYSKFLKFGISTKIIL